MLGAFALTEPQAGSDAGATRTTAQLDGDDWVINGTKVFITNAGTPLSAFVIVAAVTGRRPDGRSEISTLLVPQHTPGYQLAPPYQKLGWRASDTRELTFNDCRVPRENLVGERGAGLRQFLELLDGGRIGIAAMSLGLAQTCIDRSLAYAHTRQQFGRPIFEFEAVQFALADLQTQVDLARLMTYKAATLRDAGRPHTREAAMAKLVASETAVRAAEQAIQIHGGWGFMAENPVTRYYRDAKILTIGEGTSEVQRMVIARAMARERGLR
jgi:butyryl-CoA dehydrogenase